MKQQTSSSKNPGESVPARVYTREYYLAESAGWREYLESGLALAHRNLDHLGDHIDE